MVKTRLLTMSCVAVTSALLCAGVAVAAEHRLSMDQVRVLTFKRPFKSVSVGNALVADATVIDETHVFITGREFGTTNIVAIDEEGNLVGDEIITVTTSQGNMVTLTRGNQWYTLSCNFGRCDVKPTPGDDPFRYEPDSRAITTRETQSTDAASISAPAPQ
jgi:exosome complex RNA-binding protein Rrp42 (RNase PH superfamily)